MFLMSFADFFKIDFLKKSFRNIVGVSNELDPDQDLHSVGPGLGQSCLQMLSAEYKSPLARKDFIKFR